MGDQLTIGRVEFGPSLPATAASRPAVTAGTHFADDATLARLAALEAVAMAAASMVVHSDDGRPWWMRRYGEDRTTYCIGCGADSLSAGLCASLLTHAPDCPAIALDAALAALRDAGGAA